MRILIKGKETKGNVKLEYKGFELSLQNDHGYGELVVFDLSSPLQLGEYPNTAEGIRDAMETIDQYKRN